MSINETKIFCQNLINNVIHFIWKIRGKAIFLYLLLELFLQPLAKTDNCNR